MKITIIRMFAVLSLMASFSTLTAYAQTTGGIKFEAPFAFTVGNETLPAGKYSVQRLRQDTTDILLIRGVDNRRAVNFWVTKRQFNNETAASKVIFHQHGDKRFLKQIRYNYGDFGYELLKSRSEKDAIKKSRAGKDNLASAGTMLEVIAINGQ